MREDDFLYGAHSGIQKAVRRGDLDLAKTCFDAMWGNKVHKAWLKWRMVALVQEESWQMMGELAEFLDKKTDDEKVWRKFIYELTLASKNKDTFGLMTFALKGAPKAPFENNELKETKRLLASMGVSGDPVPLMEPVDKFCKEYKELSHYELRAIDYLRNRVPQGGMLDDRQGCLVSMILIAMRGLNKGVVREDIEYKSGEYLQLGKRPKNLKTLPWYCFDMHTAVGKIVLGIVGKRKVTDWKLTTQQLAEMWFLFESAHVPRDQMQYAPPSNDPGILDCIWWIPALKATLTSIGLANAKDAQQKWKNTCSSEVKGIVDWLLKKREEDR